MMVREAISRQIEDAVYIILLAFYLYGKRSRVLT